MGVVLLKLYLIFGVVIFFISIATMLINREQFWIFFGQMMMFKSIVFMTSVLKKFDVITNSSFVSILSVTMFVMAMSCMQSIAIRFAATKFNKELDCCEKVYTKY